MKIPRLILAGVAVTLIGCGLAVSQARGASDQMLIDFADSRRDPDGKIFHVYEYAWDDWGKKRVTDLRGKGVLVQAPSGKGVLGENRTLVRFDKAPVVELWFVIGNGNQAKAINFALTDRDGTEHHWNIPLADLPRGQLLKRRIELGKSDQQPNAGKTPGLEMKKITTWQVRGDYSDAPVEVLLVRLTGPKP